MLRSETRGERRGMLLGELMASFARRPHADLSARCGTHARLWPRVVHISVYQRADPWAPDGEYLHV
jgi:hypothetical protein